MGMMDYYGGPSPLGAGVQSFADSFMKAYQTLDQSKFQREKLAEEKRQAGEMEKYRQRIMEQIQAQINASALEDEIKRAAFKRQQDIESATKGFMNEAVPYQMPGVAPQSSNIGSQTAYGPSLASGLMFNTPGVSPIETTRPRSEVMPPDELFQGAAQRMMPIDSNAAIGLMSKGVGLQKDQSEIVKNLAEANRQKAPARQVYDSNGTLYHGVTGETVGKVEPPAKEVNVANDLDTILASDFPGYYTDPQVRKTALDKFGSDKKYSADVLARVSRFRQSQAAPFFNVTPTSEGLVTINSRTGLPERNTGLNKPTPEAEMKQGKELGTLLDSVARIKELYNPAYVGPLAGRLGQTGQKFVNLPEQQVKFYAYVNDAKDALLRARSGAQINEQEYKRLVAFLPDANLPEKNFQARVNRFEEQLKLIGQNRAKEMKAGGYSPTNPGTIQAGPQATHKYIPGKGIVRIGE